MKLSNSSLKGFRKILLLVLSIQILTYIVGCKSIESSGESADTLAIGATTQVPYLPANPETKVGTSGFEESKGLKSNISARYIQASSNVVGCDTVYIPAQNILNQNVKIYTKADVSNLPLLPVIRSCLPYTIDLSYKCNKTGVEKECYTGRVVTPTNIDILDAVNNIEVNVDMKPTQASLASEKVKIKIDILSSKAEVQEFFYEDCVNITNPIDKGVSGKSPAIKVLGKCIETFYKDYNVDVFIYDMFTSSSMKKTKCNYFVSNSNTKAEDGTAISQENDFFITQFEIDGKRYNIDEKHPVELLFSYRVNKSFKVSYEISRTVDGVLNCYTAEKRWNKEDR